MVLYNASATVMAIQTTQTRMERKLILPSTRRATFEWDGSLWTLMSPPFVLTGSLTASLLKAGAAIPANDMSDETTFTLNGAKVGMRVDVAPTTAISGDATVTGRVTADNTIAIRARNGNLTTALTIGSATYLVKTEYLN